MTQSRMTNHSRDVRGGVAVENYNGGPDLLRHQQQTTTTSVQAQAVPTSHLALNHRNQHQLSPTSHYQHQRHNSHHHYQHHYQHHNSLQGGRSGSGGINRLKRPRTSRRQGKMHLTSETQQTQQQQQTTTTAGSSLLPDYAITADLLVERTLDGLLAEHPGELIRTGELVCLLFSGVW